MLFEKACQEALNSLVHSSVSFSGKLILEKNGRFNNGVVLYEIFYRKNF